MASREFREAQISLLCGLEDPPWGLKLSFHSVARENLSFASQCGLTEEGRKEGEQNATLIFLNMPSTIHKIVNCHKEIENERRQMPPAEP